MDQEAAIEELRERYARGGLAIEEYRRLMGKLMVTTDPNECQAIIDQIPPEPERSPAEPSPVRARPQMTGGRHHVSALFGSVDRANDLWELGPETDASATFGEVRLDVRMARLSEGENVLRLNALFGEIKVIVPEGLPFSVEGNAYFGEVSLPGRKVSGIATHDSFVRHGASSTPRLRIEATATFGQVEVNVG